MQRDWRTSGIRVAVILAGVVLLNVLGCGLTAPRTYEVKGKVEFPEGDVKQLAGGHVEVVLTGDLRVGASGEIQEDGSFTLETIQAGKPRPGARKGEYLARIVLSDEDRGHERRQTVGIAPAFSQYATSGLSIQVPASGEVILKLSAP